MNGPDISSLRFENIAFGYDGRPPVFKRLALEFPEQKYVWIKGNPGGGKSTILKILAGLVVPQSGLYWIGDRNVLDLTFQEFLPYRLQIGYCFDNGGLLANRTLFENLLLPLTFHQLCPRDEAEERIRFWMRKFNIDGVADQRPFAVTGGQRKSTVLLRAFIHYPQLVLLDDPMSGLKEDGRRAFAELVHDCESRHGLKQIMFCAERELPLPGFQPAVLSIQNAPLSQMKEAS